LKILKKNLEKVEIFESFGKITEKRGKFAKF
jgi:hypothetical protein